MSIPDLDALRVALGSSRDLVSLNQASLAALVGRTYDGWTTGAPAGVAPVAAVVPTRATQGALGQQNAGGSLEQRIVGHRLSLLNPGQWILCDRLSHSGGLSGTVTGAQVTNLPTAAITRGSGVGVWLGLTIYSSPGTTVTTVSATYTNSGGTGSRVTPLVPFGGTANREAGRIILLPLQEGDVGVNSVQSVTLSASTVSAAGNFGVTLLRPLYAMLVPDVSGVGVGGLFAGQCCGLMPRLPDDSCLSVIAISAGTNIMGAGALLLGED